MNKIILIVMVAIMPLLSQAQTKIKIIENTKIIGEDSVYLSYEFYIPVPAIFATVPDKASTLSSFAPLYPGLDRLQDTDIVFKFNDKFSVDATESDIHSHLNLKYSRYVYGIEHLQIMTTDWMNGQTWDGVNWIDK